MNVGQMEVAVRSMFRDAPEEFIVPEEVLFWLNEAQADIAIRERLLEAEATILASGGALALPAEFVTPKELWPTLTGEDNLIEFKDDDDFIYVPSDRAYARVFNNTIQLNPQPIDGTSYKLRYVRLPATLLNDASVPEVSLEYQYRMIKYVQAQGLYKEREDSLADRKMAEYEAGLLPRPVGNMQKNYGPLNLSVVGGSFRDATGY